jgi:hypothetical protein
LSRRHLVDDFLKRLANFGMEGDFALEGELAIENRDGAGGARGTRRRETDDGREESLAVGREAGIRGCWG